VWHWAGVRHATGGRPELAELVAAVDDRRPVEARLTGGFKWGPVPSETRGDAASRISPEVAIANAHLEQRLRAGRTRRPDG
jgi:hypothetical protein